MKNLTDITFILDRSGSMASMVNDVVGGYRSFVEQQKADKSGDIVMSLVQFDTIYENVFSGIPIENLSPALNFVPRGGTALRDAIGRTINETGARLRALPASERPNKVLIVILTDGEENSSHEFSHDQIKRMIEHQQNKYAWEFLFLGANFDAFHVGASYGINLNTVTNYTYTGGGLRAAFDSVSCYASTTKSGGVHTSTLSQTQALNESKLSDDELAKKAGLNGDTFVTGSSCGPVPQTTTTGKMTVTVP
jgi:uncharacterized protein YegL